MLCAQHKHPFWLRAWNDDAYIWWMCVLVYVKHAWAWKYTNISSALAVYYLWLHSVNDPFCTYDTNTWREKKHEKCVHIEWIYFLASNWRHSIHFVHIPYIYIYIFVVFCLMLSGHVCRRVASVVPPDGRKSEWHNRFYDHLANWSSIRHLSNSSCIPVDAAQSFNIQYIHIDNQSAEILCDDLFCCRAVIDGMLECFRLRVTIYCAA